MLLTEASYNLFTRPRDEHFASFQELLDTSKRSQEDGVESLHRANEIRFVEAGNQIRVDLGGFYQVRPTPWAMTQIAGGCRVPTSVLEHLRTETAVRVLNETFQRQDLSERLALVDGDKLRALTSSSYSRLWDVEILQEIDRWLLPDGRFVPAMPTINTDSRGTNVLGNNKPALFRGDRDSFCFFYSPKKPEDDGLGGLRKGILVFNSEVGARSFGFSTFYFREMCSNFLIWDATQIKKRKAVHKGDLLRFFREFKLDLIEASSEFEPKERRVFMQAAETPFVGDGTPTRANLELAQTRLEREFGTSGKLAVAITDSAMLPENPSNLTVWGITNGITSLAKQETWASDLMEMSSLVGEVMELCR